jgi:hypothetical protein
MLVILFERNDYMSNPHLEKLWLTSDYARTMKTIRYYTVQGQADH